MCGKEGDVVLKIAICDDISMKLSKNGGIDMDDLAKKIVELSESLDEDTIERATDEELMTYLFLVEKMKVKLEKMCNLDKK